MADELAIFDEATIRRVWHEDQWWFSVVDVIGVLTESKDPGAYWRKLRQRLLQKEGATEVVTNCHALKLPGRDGKLYATDCATSEMLLRLMQSVPSPKAEPFKLWLAQVGQERLEEAEDPAAAFDEWRRRAILSYMAQGYSETWATNRVDGIIARKALTREWSVRGIDERDFAALTNRLHMGEFGLSIVDHAEYKGFEIVIVRGRRTFKGNVRSGMTPMEQAVATFGDNLTRALHQERDSYGLPQITRDVDDAGHIAGLKRLEIERLTGKPVVSPRNMTIERDGGLWGQLTDGED